MISSVPVLSARPLSSPLVTLIATLIFLTTCITLWRRVARLNHIPGSKIWALTSIPLAYREYFGARMRTVKSMHDAHGRVVRVGHNEVSFQSSSAVRTIYGAGSHFARTPFYAKLFTVYGHPNLIAITSNEHHGQNKKFLSHFYSKTSITSPAKSSVIEAHVADFLAMVVREQHGPTNVFPGLHYFAMDVITDFIYGKSGRTQCMNGNEAHRVMLEDVMKHGRRRFAWFAIHFPSYTDWSLSQTGLVEQVFTALGLLPMEKPTIWTGLREHGLAAFYRAKADFAKAESGEGSRMALVDHLLQERELGKANLADMDIASECADDILAGVETVSGTMTFVIWSLSLPEHATYQQRLCKEIQDLGPFQSGVVSIKQAATLVFLDAVIKETLRLYSPIQGHEPRVSGVDAVVDGYNIPANTIVSCSPYLQHRDQDAFPDPLVWDPERWLEGHRDTGDASRRSSFPFSSGARMCVGMHLANAEMTALLASLYRTYKTSLTHSDEAWTPALSSRSELMYDEVIGAKGRILEHQCLINFEKHEV